MAKTKTTVSKGPEKGTKDVKPPIPPATTPGMGGSKKKGK